MARETYKQRLPKMRFFRHRESCTPISALQVKSIASFGSRQGAYLSMRLRTLISAAAILLLALPAAAQSKRKVILDQDARGPATTDQQSMLIFLQSPEVETLGITVVSGDQWRDEEIAHTLRMLEIIGRTDVPVLPGAVFPLINRMELIERWEQIYGKVNYQGAWNK